MTNGSMTRFEGKFFRTGDVVTDADLHPTPEYPEVPLLIEYVGKSGPPVETGSCRGHRRCLDTHILWRFNSSELVWDEIARTESHGHEWVAMMAPLVRGHLVNGSPRPNAGAAAATSRVLASLDAELQQLLDADDRRRCMSLVYDQFTARLLEEAG